MSSRQLMNPWKVCRMTFLKKLPTESLNTYGYVARKGNKISEGSP